MFPTRFRNRATFCIFKRLSRTPAFDKGLELWSIKRGKIFQIIYREDINVYIYYLSLPSFIFLVPHIIFRNSALLDFFIFQALFFLHFFASSLYNVNIHFNASYQKYLKQFKSKNITHHTHTQTIYLKNIYFSNKAKQVIIIKELKSFRTIMYYLIYR